ncbi:MAG: KOW motif-containing protein [Christensenellaceae bacterium]|jgi:transcriptional antiterminator NusG|nr:KOW motif-containing protein [Christensenellaceae bacterium]
MEENEIIETEIGTNEQGDNAMSGNESEIANDEKTTENTAETANGESNVGEISPEMTDGEPVLKDALPPELIGAGNNRMDTEAHWYVLHTFNGYEAVAEDNLKKVIEKYKLQDRILEIFIPKEEALVERKDKKVMVEMKTMPTYIFIKMIYGDDLWHTITRTRGITGFVGPKGRPLPLTNTDVIKMKLEKKVNVTTKIEKDDLVQVIDGPLAGQTAKVTDADAVNSKVTVIVTMFGRSNKVDLHISQVKKI